MADGVVGVKWPGGAKAAISVTYDGGLPEHLLLAEPLLRALNLRATFYLNATFFLENPRAWSNVASLGHEVGNHCLFGVTGPRGELPNWTLDMVEDDLSMTEALLKDYLPPPRDRSFAYPGDHPISAEGTYDVVVDRQFQWARTRHEGLNHAVFCNPKALRCIPTFGVSGAGLVERAEEAFELGAWAIFLFEGIGPGRDACEERDHELFLRYLAEREHAYVEPVRTVAQHIEIMRQSVTFT